METFTDISQAKLIYMGTPDISARVLQRLIEAGFHFVAVVSNEDKAVGRKHIIEPTPVKEVALRYGIPVYQPHSFKNGGDAFLSEIPADLILTMAYGKIVPSSVLNHPKYGCLNLHGSLLPKYRGASPIQMAIRDGLDVTGVSLMQMVEAMDAGEVYATKEIPVSDSDNYETLGQKMSEAAAELAIENVLSYLQGKLKGVPQNEEEVTFCGKITPEQEHIPLSLPARMALRYINSLSPAPGGYVNLDGKKLKIFSAEVDSRSGEAGQIISTKKELVIACGEGSLSLMMIQLEGKKPMMARDFVNGFHIGEGIKAE